MLTDFQNSFTESLWWLQTQVMKSVTFGKVQTASSSGLIVSTYFCYAADYEKVY